MSATNLLKNAVKYPTSIIVRGQDLLGIELAKSLLEQGGFVILIDQGSKEVEKYLPLIDAYTNLILMDFSGLATLQSDLRRLDYVFYLNHHFSDQSQKISTQEFLQASNYLDSVLDLTAKFDAKFLLTTSIKAHQSIVASRVIDLNYELQTAEKYSVYSELEIQRYSESLVREYQEKVGINTRIIRLGTLLGRGMEIDLESIPIKLIIEALQGERLIIPGDGLESDYYVHYLDAAYGIIKAQFSPNTKGAIYTLANEEEVTLLGLSYKLIELVPTAKEIYFDPTDHSLPPIKLYKPAINLTSIGWSPRISFDRALSQTIDFIKSKLSEVNWNVGELDKELIPIVNKADNKKSAKDKLLDFFFIAQKEDEVQAAKVPPTNISTEGALARLIAERKNQEKARKGSIILANNQLREALQKKPERTPLQKLDRYLNDLFYRIKQRLNVLKNMTLTDFAFWVLGIAAFITIYLILIAPALRLTRSLYLTYTDLSELEQSVNEMRFNDANLETLSLKNNIKDVQARFSDIEYLFTLSQNQTSYTKLQQFLEQMQQYITGYENITKALIPYESLANKYDPGFVQRLDEQLLTVETNSSYAKEITDMYGNRSLLTIGINAVASSRSEVETYLLALPDFIKQIYEKSLLNLKTVDSYLPFTQEVYNYLPMLTGKDRARYYLVLLQDEQRFSPSGGELVGYLLLKVENGAVISVKSADFIDFETINPDLSPLAIKNIALVSKELITPANIKFSDINMIPNQKLWFDEVEEIVEFKEGVAVDMSLALNLHALALVSGEGVTFKQQEVSNDDFFAKINDILGTGATKAQRNELLLRYLATLLEQKANDPLNDMAFITGLTQAINDGHLRFDSNEPLYQKFLSVVLPAVEAKDILNIGMEHDTNELDYTQLPEISISGTVQLQKDTGTVKELKLYFEGNDIASSYYCSPAVVKDWKVTETKVENYSQIFDLDQLGQICAIFLPDVDNKYQISYQSLPLEKAGQASYNYFLKINSLPGVLVNYDIVFSYTGAKSDLIALTPGVIDQVDGFLYKGQFYGSQVFSFKLQ